MATARIVHCSVHAAKFTERGMEMVLGLSTTQTGERLTVTSTISATSLVDVTNELDRLAKDFGFACVGSAHLRTGRKFPGFDAAVKAATYRDAPLHPFYLARV